MSFAEPFPTIPPSPAQSGPASATRLLAAVLAVLIGVYAVAVFLTRDVWADRDGTRLTLTVQTKDGSALSPDTVEQGVVATDTRLRGAGVSDAQVGAAGNDVVATFPRYGLDTEALKAMFGPSGSKTLYVRPVVRATPAKAPATSPGPTASPSLARPERIADEKKLRQSTNPSMQMLALQYQATRCGDDDVLAGRDDPNLPLITCSRDGQTVYQLSKSILGGSQIVSARVGTDSTGQHVIDVQFDDDAARRWASFTAANIGTQTSFTVDSRVLSAPVIHEEIPDGRTQISGQFSEGTARDLVEGINRGISPVTLLYSSSTDEKVPATTLYLLIRAAVVIAGMGLAVLTVGTVVYLLRTRRRSTALTPPT